MENIGRGTSWPCGQGGGLAVVRSPVRTQPPLEYGGALVVWPGMPFPNLDGRIYQSPVFYATDSGNEDSTSYNIPSSDIPSSEHEFPEPSPSRYNVERSKKQLDQQQSSEKEPVNEEGDSKFSHF